MLAGTIGTSRGQQKQFPPDPSPPGAAVYFVSSQGWPDGPHHLHAEFGLKGMGVAPAGSDKANAGHHHLLIDAELPRLDQPIPSDFDQSAFWRRANRGRSDLAEGGHTLQLVLGDKDRIPGRFR